MDLATKEMLVDALKDFEGTMIFVSHDRMFLRGLGSRVLELGGESGTDRHPTVYPGSYVEYVQNLGHEAPGIYSYVLGSGLLWIFVSIATSHDG
jgi:ATPase subunit of ABC transporter with duplicated ATPase domains